MDETKRLSLAQMVCVYVVLFGRQLAAAVKGEKFEDVPLLRELRGKLLVELHASLDRPDVLGPWFGKLTDSEQVALRAFMWEHLHVTPEKIPIPELTNMGVRILAAEFRAATYMAGIISYYAKLAPATDDAEKAAKLKTVGDYVGPELATALLGGVTRVKTDTAAAAGTEFTADAPSPPAGASAAQAEADAADDEARLERRRADDVGGETAYKAGE